MCIIHQKSLVLPYASDCRRHQRRRRFRCRPAKYWNNLSELGTTIHTQKRAQVRPCKTPSTPTHLHAGRTTTSQSAHVYAAMLRHRRRQSVSVVMVLPGRHIRLHTLFMMESSSSSSLPLPQAHGRAHIESKCYHDDAPMHTRSPLTVAGTWAHGTHGRFIHSDGMALLLHRFAKCDAATRCEHDTRHVEVFEKQSMAGWLNGLGGLV